MTNDYTYYYVELDDFDKKDFRILSYGDIVGGLPAMPEVLKNTKGVVKQVTEKEYHLLQACNGNLLKGISTLADLQSRIFQYKEDLSEVTR